MEENTIKDTMIKILHTYGVQDVVNEMGGKNAMDLQHFGTQGDNKSKQDFWDGQR